LDADDVVALRGVVQGAVVKDEAVEAVVVDGVLVMAIVV